MPVPALVRINKVTSSFFEIVSSLNCQTKILNEKYNSTRRTNSEISLFMGGRNIFQKDLTHIFKFLQLLLLQALLQAFYFVLSFSSFFLSFSSFILIFIFIFYLLFLIYYFYFILFFLFPSFF